jgi:hypothetical protein
MFCSLRLCPADALSDRTVVIVLHGRTPSQMAYDARQEKLRTQHCTPWQRLKMMFN